MSECDSYNNTVFKNVLNTNQQYEDFETIDWQRDIAKDRKRHRGIEQRKKESCCERLKAAFDAWSGWLCVFLVGILSGVVAGIVDIGATWFTDIKLGICPSAFYLNKEQCCWSSEEQKIDISGKCSHWMTWAEIYGMEVESYAFNYFVYVLVAVIFAGLASTFVRIFAPYACGSGIPEIKTILSGFVIHGYLDKWTFVIKGVAIMLAVAAGLTLGKEGPMIHMACCTGNILANIFPKYKENEVKKREILSAASAAGVAIAFGAPIGGVLFSLEEVSYYFPLKTLWRSFFCALIAAFILQTINPFGNDHSVLFFVHYNNPWNLTELIPFVLLGIIGGLIGVAFIRANIFWCKFRKSSSLGKYPIIEVLTVASATTLFAFPNPFTRMNSSELIYLLYSQCRLTEGATCDSNSKLSQTSTQFSSAENNSSGTYMIITQIILSFAFKFITTIVTFGIKVPSGLFVPSLCMGAIVGRLVGIGLESMLYTYKDSIPSFVGMHCQGGSCITPGLYAMVGSAAVLGGITRMTVSLVVIMFEVTGGVRYIVPLMAACMTSKWVADAFDSVGIYDAHILLNEYPFLDIKEDFDSESMAKDIMQPRRDEVLQVLTTDSTVNDVIDMISTTNFSGFPIVDSTDSKLLIGYVDRCDLRSAIDSEKRHNNDITGDSLLYFSKPVAILNTEIKQPSPLFLNKIVDFAPTCITDETPIERVIDMFRKLGLRNCLVTHNGRLLGVITKKDILQHIRKGS